MFCGNGKDRPRIHSWQGIDNAIAILHPPLPLLLSPCSSVMLRPQTPFSNTISLHPLRFQPGQPHTAPTSQYYCYDRFSREPKLHNCQCESSSSRKKQLLSQAQSFPRKWKQTTILTLLPSNVFGKGPKLASRSLAIWLWKSQNLNCSNLGSPLCNIRIIRIEPILLSSYRCNEGQTRWSR